MNALSSGVGKQLRTETFEALTDGRRRCILSILDDVSSLPEWRLATRIAAFERETQTVDEAYVETVRTDLSHVHLPVLVDAGLVERGRASVSVTATGRKVLDEQEFQTVVETATREWDPVLDCLASEQRRIVLDVLQRRDDPMARTDLARAVAARDGEQSTDAEDVSLSLYHVHLPKLVAAGLVERQSDETVTYREHPDLPVADALATFESGHQ